MTALQEKQNTVVPKRLVGKVALVTGGSRGIGEGIALRLALEGANVAITYAKSKDGAAKVVEQLKAQNVQAKAYAADASVPSQSQSLIDSVIKDFGQVDILVNNAGVFEYQPLENVTIQHYETVFDVNVKGVIATTVAVLPKLNDGGRIINISSVAAKAAIAGYSIYSASKAALDALTRVWAHEVGQRQITVNAVAPGATESDMYHQAMTPEIAQEIIGKTALGRVGQPADIASVVAFLASADGAWITGQTITADGGLNLG